MLQESLAILFLFADTFSPALRTQFIIEGDRFDYSCLYNLTLKADWKFEALGENTAISVNRELTNKNLLFIPNVQSTNAGKFSYLGETSAGQCQRMCSVTLCVIKGKFIQSNQASLEKYFRYFQVHVIQCNIEKKE